MLSSKASDPDDKSGQEPGSTTPADKRAKAKKAVNFSWFKVWTFSTALVCICGARGGRAWPWHLPFRGRLVCMMARHAKVMERGAIFKGICCGLSIACSFVCVNAVAP